MKSIQNQYRDLKEGKMSQANFMRNVRMTFPHLVTNVTSFNDSIKILKNRGLLSEIKINEGEEIKINGKLVTNYKQNGDTSYSVEYEDGTKETIYVSNDNWDIINNVVRKNLNETKTKLHPNQIHPQELRMGIKVEMEHTDDPKKAEKIALDHLAENPFYYTALKLSGVESPSAPKVKTPAKTKAKKEVTELVDKDNAMKPVKGVEKIKASANKAHKETNKGVKGVEELTHASKKAKGIKQVMSPTGGKMKTIREAMDPDRLAQLVNLLRTNYGMNNNDIHATLVAKYNLTDREANMAINPPSGKKTDFEDSFRKFTTKLREMVQEVLVEYYDGRDNLIDDIAAETN